jgi:hypothetical protein
MVVIVELGGRGKEKRTIESMLSKYIASVQVDDIAMYKST